MDYCDIDYLEQYGIFTNPSEAERAMLTVHITQASAMIDNYCDRIFGLPDGSVVTAHTFTKDNGLLPIEGRTLWLDGDLCSTPTYAEAPAPTVTLIPTTTPYNRIVREDGLWPDPTVVTGFWAYAMTPNATIVNTTARLAVWIYHQRESVMSAGNSITPPNDIPADIKLVLAPYKRVRLP